MTVGGIGYGERFEYSNRGPCVDILAPVGSVTPFCVQNDYFCVPVIVRILTTTGYYRMLKLSL